MAHMRRIVDRRTAVVPFHMAPIQRNKFILDDDKRQNCLSYMKWIQPSSWSVNCRREERALLFASLEATMVVVEQT